MERKENIKSENIREKTSGYKKVNKNRRRKIDKKKVAKFLVCVVLILVIIIVISNGIKANAKEKKAEEVFGKDYCDSVLHMATNDLQEHVCKICGAEFKDSGMRADICNECSIELDRCNFCGKKLTKEIKQERNELLGE